MATLASQRYAESLFEVAQEEKIVDALLEQTAFVKKAFEDTPDFMKVLTAPMISFENKKAVIENIYKDKINPYLLNFLLLITEKGRINKFAEMADGFKALYYKANNIQEVTVITAIEMDEQLSNKMKDKLCKITGKDVIMNSIVDTQILGGVVIRLGESQIDTSVRTRLNELQQQMTQIIA